MAKRNSSGDLNVELVSAALGEITNAAYTVRDLALRLVQMAGSDREIVAVAMSIECLISRAGWLADEGLEALGEPPAVGDARAWMTSPRFQKAAEVGHG